MCHQNRADKLSEEDYATVIIPVVINPKTNKRFHIESSA